MRAVIIAGGDVGDYIKNYIKGDDFVICADSGLDRAEKFGIKPNIVLGDMDSVISKNIGEDAVIYPCRKDFTDSEIAVDYAKEHGFSQFLMFGMIGSRMDHTIANITLLKNLENAVIINENNEIYLLRDKIKIEAPIGTTISILPIFGDVSGVTTYGLDYPLTNGSITCGTSLGVSNVMTEAVCEITVEKGMALVIRSKE